MKTLWKIFRAPLAFGLLSLFGLLSALLADGVWDALSWICLGIVSAATVYFYNRRVPSSSPGQEGFAPGKLRSTHASMSRSD